ncbi:MAG TPA: glutamine amidotransferase [Chloroflexota bacterium]|nr:glutamine amidotransferase [Chloroflexota bacterium]
MDLTIGYLYATGMNVYGDRGNILTLVQRCRWRGINVEVIERGVGENSSLDRFDLLFAGGGQDRDQIAVSKDLQEDTGRALIDAVEREVVVLTICGTYQLLGHSFKTGTGDVLPGLGIFDASTEAGPRRFIGDVIVDVRLADGTLSLVGFENHSGRTFLHSGAPLGTVLVGAGNNGDDRTEGASYKNAFGTYLHGPLLPKNPGFADHLIRLALARRYGDVELPSLDDRLELAAHQAMIERIRRRGRVNSGVR